MIDAMRVIKIFEGFYTLCIKLVEMFLNLFHSKTLGTKIKH